MKSLLRSKLTLCIAKNKIKNKTLFYSFFFVSHPLLLYLIIMIIYWLIIIYFFMDPVLCQDINSDASQEATGIQDTKASCLDKVTTQQPLVDQEINERLKELKDISALPKENSLSCLTPACSGVRHVSTLSPEERLSALNALYNSDMDELERAGEKYKY